MTTNLILAVSGVFLASLSTVLYINDVNGLFWGVIAVVLFFKIDTNKPLINNRKENKE